MSSINALLNHEPASGQQRRESRPSIPPLEPHAATTTTFEAADALTALATLGTGQQYAPSRDSRELPSPTAVSHAPRRTSSFGSQAAPVEPSPPIEQPQAHSPTLDQYHHGSRSPEEQRRQSLLHRNSSPAPTLAPIQNLSNILNDKIDNEAQHPTSTPSEQDVSQFVPPTSHSADEDEQERDETQNREPAFVRDQPTTGQIREPEPTTSTPYPISTHAPPLLETEPQLPSPLPAIKNEPAGTPREATPSTSIMPTSERQSSVTTENVDVETRKAIEALKQNDLGLRAKRPASVTDSVTSPTVLSDTKPVTLPAPSKKRPAPSTSAIKKKGTAAPKKPVPKRRKIDAEGESIRSTTPTTTARPKSRTDKGGKKGSQAGTPAAESSPAPDNSSQAHASEDDAESSDDNALYCICRKPDNHRWMIGCDGGCDDWFHGSCVNMIQSDEDLVDKFICPNCEAIGRGQTTWKPMCRRNGCRKPARLVKGRESKYCSDECGVLFMQDQLQRTAGAKRSTSAPSKKPKKKNPRDSEDRGNATDEDEEPTPLGGVLRSKDLKALVVASNNIEDFKRLGSGVLSPPQTASPSQVTFEGPDGIVESTVELPFTTSELARLKALQIEKLDLKTKLEALKDREKFVSMVREQATRVAEREKIKPKEFCGYDSRLSWSDAEFLVWRRGKMGCAAFKFATLTPNTEQLASLDMDGDVHMNGVNGENGESKDREVVCMKKRCPKHPQWQKLNLQDARFEEVEAMEAIKECEKEERQVHERARRRGRKDVMEAEFVGAEKKTKNREGWVEEISALS
ncbi:hypothetical protein B0J11DRAFT_425102 [Dendryphion nanum]|uniref:PHD-type domain-containing protein n=1 Tax=Dendryphion nanum TaxID=256645 RepID=A0A9P9EE91_9PLEO|nr:hypothetical protein B0J11DRAFT_425102 [Dendryphion nanum]